MNFLNKEQTRRIRKEVQQRGITLPQLEEDLVDFLCTAVENELQHEPDFETALQKVLTTIKPNELKMAQERTEELLSNKLSLMQKIVTSALALLGFGFVLHLLAVPLAKEIILTATLILTSLYVYSMIRWYITFNSNSLKQKLAKLVFTLGLFVVFLMNLGFIFKLNHFTGGSIMLVCSLAILIFLPVIISIYFFSRQKNTSLRFVLPIIDKHKFKTEIVLISTLLLGFVARFLLINNLGNMLIIISLFCISVLFISYTWQFYVGENNQLHRVLLLLTSIICYVTLLMVGLFKIMHWPLPFGRWNDISFLLLGWIAVAWYGKQFFYHRNARYALLLLCSCLLACYAFLLFANLSQHSSFVYTIYSFPVLILFIGVLLAFYKHQLFRVLAVCLLAYFLLAYPYALMHNKKVIEKVYQYDPEFVELYHKTYSDPDNIEQWKQLIEYEHKSRTL